MTSARLTRPSIGETTLREVQIELGGAQRGRHGVDVGRRLGRGAGAALALFERHRVLARQAIGAPHFDRGAIARHRRLRELRAQTIDLRLKRTIVDLEQQLSLPHEAAFLERHVRDEAGDARTDGDRLHGLEPAGEFVPFGDVARDRRRGGDLGKRRRRRRWFRRGCRRRRSWPQSPARASAPSLRAEEKSSDERDGCVFMTYAACRRRAASHNPADSRDRASSEYGMAGSPGRHRPPSSKRTRPSWSGRPSGVGGRLAR